MAVVTSAADLGPIIRDARIAMGWTQRELAAKCAVAHTYIARIERSSRSASLGVIGVILAELGLSLEVIPARVFEAGAAAGLDERDVRILIGYANGESFAQIARATGNTASYVTKLAPQMHHKLGAVDRAHAVAVGYDLGILTPRGGAA